MKKSKESKNQKEKVSYLREKYLLNYCKTKGWNPNELTTGQMLIIVNKPEYKNPV